VVASAMRDRDAEAADGVRRGADQSRLQPRLARRGIVQARRGSGKDPRPPKLAAARWVAREGSSRFIGKDTLGVDCAPNEADSGHLLGVLPGKRRLSVNDSDIMSNLLT
jgi:hypothetical protein